ncbi:leucine rich repeat gene family protein-like protein [Glossina pallidipes salivary gland hypertrophy virus]|uniref:Leucine rich repeat gene family protein-like protein n=1 Tax=Glossina hytrovirus (isolate Glossina pallidipes/Ethiopia/Seibersdorf/-) TaxID=379529 RepID=A0A0Y0J9Y5_GHVS|nr:leucine rich repeat gene family protein-like protein [Glossina pallidipes salivary gland hypertrophy virus]
MRHSSNKTMDTEASKILYLDHILEKILQHSSIETLYNLSKVNTYLNYQVHKYVKKNYDMLNEWLDEKIIFINEDNIKFGIEFSLQEIFIHYIWFNRCYYSYQLTTTSSALSKDIIVSLMDKNYISFISKLVINITTREFLKSKRLAYIFPYVNSLVLNGWECSKLNLKSIYNFRMLKNLYILNCTIEKPLLSPVMKFKHLKKLLIDVNAISCNCDLHLIIPNLKYLHQLILLNVKSYSCSKFKKLLKIINSKITITVSLIVDDDSCAELIASRCSFDYIEIYENYWLFNLIKQNEYKVVRCTLELNKEVSLIYSKCINRIKCFLANQPHVRLLIKNLKLNYIISNDIRLLCTEFPFVTHVTISNSTLTLPISKKYIVVFFKNVNILRIERSNLNICFLNQIKSCYISKIHIIKTVLTQHFYLFATDYIMTRPKHINLFKD